MSNKNSPRAQEVLDYFQCSELDDSEKSRDFKNESNIEKKGVRKFPTKVGHHQIKFYLVDGKKVYPGEGEKQHKVRMKLPLTALEQVQAKSVACG